MKILDSFLFKPSLKRTLFFMAAAIGLEYLRKWSDEKTKERHLQQMTGRPSQIEASERKFAGNKRDYVDEGSWESFPASDASAKY